MAQRGRPPKPLEQKKKLGNPGKRALPDDAALQKLEPASGTPTPPRPLLQPGLELWDRIWQTGAQWISPETDLEILIMTCELVDERWNLRIRVMQKDEPRTRRALRELDRQIVSNLSLLGLTPSDRSRLGVAEVKAKSKLQEMMERHDRL